MHELSIAQSLVECVGEEAARRGVDRVVAIHMRVGRLSGVLPDALLFSFQVAAEGTPAEGARLEIEEVAITIYCPECRAERVLAGRSDVCCPVCGTPSPEVRRGAELELVSIEIPEDTEWRAPAIDP